MDSTDAAGTNTHFAADTLQYSVAGQVSAPLVAVGQGDAQDFASVDANGKTTNIQVIAEPSGYQLGDYLKKVLPRLAFLPGYRNGKPTAATYTLTWWFGRTVGW